MINALVELSQTDRRKMDLSELSIPKLVNDCIEMIDDRTNVEFHISCVSGYKCTTLVKRKSNL
jgi:hypothetical protein